MALRRLRLAGGASPPAKRSHGDGPGAAAAAAPPGAPGDVSLAARMLPGFCGAIGAASAAARLDVADGPRADEVALLCALFLQYGESWAIDTGNAVVEACRLPRSTVAQGMASRAGGLQPFSPRPAQASL